MKKSLESRIKTKRYRVERRIGQICFDVMKALLLTGIVFVVSALMIFAYNYAITLPFFRIQETVVRGCKELTEKDILSLAALKDSQYLMAVNTEVIARRVKKNSWVKNVFVGRELPNRLVIEIRERKVVAVVKSSHDMFLIDEEGVPFKKKIKTDNFDLPILTGFYRNGTVDSDLLRKSVELLRYLAQAEEFPTINNVSEVHGSDVMGFNIYTNTGLCLQMGFGCYENKLKRLSPIIADLERKNLKTSYLNIDLRDPTKITVKRNDVLGPADVVPPKGAKNKYRT
ncbi:MAG: FtsQ-type POTRA domain-containing protein [Deltaproteobacteria bacterium]|nr:FtsQ-type POTRA domain-containing protein [Deltaproteobacteria bacterium]